MFGDSMCWGVNVFSSFKLFVHKYLLTYHAISSYLDPRFLSGFYKRQIPLSALGISSTYTGKWPADHALTVCNDTCQLDRRKIMILPWLLFFNTKTSKKSGRKKLFPLIVKGRLVFILKNRIFIPTLTKTQSIEED